MRWWCHFLPGDHTSKSGVNYIYVSERCASSFKGWWDASGSDIMTVISRNRVQPHCSRYLLSWMHLRIPDWPWTAAVTSVEMKPRELLIFQKKKVPSWNYRAERFPSVCKASGNPVLTKKPYVIICHHQMSSKMVRTRYHSTRTMRKHAHGAGSIWLICTFYGAS